MYPYPKPPIMTLETVILGPVVIDEGPEIPPGEEWVIKEIPVALVPEIVTPMGVGVP